MCHEGEATRTQKRQLGPSDFRKKNSSMGSSGSRDVWKPMPHVIGVKYPRRHPLPYSESLGQT